MSKERITVFLHNKTMKGIQLSNYSVIEEDLFAGRDDIVKVILPEGVKEISSNAFEGCVNLKEVVLPDSLEKIGEEAFAGCVDLEIIQYSEKVEVAGNAFLGCNLLK